MGSPSTLRRRLGSWGRPPRDGYAPEGSTDHLPTETFPALAPLGQIWISSSSDGREHLVTDQVLAHTTDGRPMARCGRQVLIDALDTPPRSRCMLCAGTPN